MRVFSIPIGNMEMEIDCANIDVYRLLLNPVRRVFQVDSAYA